MRKTTRFILIALMTVVSCNLYAQLGLQGGYVYMPSNGNLTLGDFQEFSGTTRNHGFQAGLTYDFRLRGDLGMQTALLYTFSGGKTREFDRTLTIPNVGVRRGTQLTTSRYQFLELPVRVSYALPVTNDFRFFFFGGPSFSYALKGKSKSQLGGSPFNRNEYYNVYEVFDISPFELKVGGGLGAYYKHYQVKLGYDQGILNLYTGDSRKPKLRRNQFTVSIGYVF